MKALCLLLILANVSLFLWEYGEGDVNDEKDPATQMASPGVNTIFLVNEVEQDSELVGSGESRAGQGLDSEPASTKITQPQLEQSITTPSSKTDAPKQ